MRVRSGEGGFEPPIYLIQSQVSEISHSLANSGANSKKCGERGRFHSGESGELPKKRQPHTSVLIKMIPMSSRSRAELRANASEDLSRVTNVTQDPGRGG